LLNTKKEVNQQGVGEAPESLAGLTGESFLTYEASSRKSTEMPFFA
jgi:hypothetical protein